MRCHATPLGPRQALRQDPGSDPQVRVVAGSAGGGPRIMSRIHQDVHWHSVPACQGGASGATAAPDPSSRSPSLHGGADASAFAGAAAGPAPVPSPDFRVLHAALGASLIFGWPQHHTTTSKVERVNSVIADVLLSFAGVLLSFADRGQQAQPSPSASESTSTPRGASSPANSTSNASLRLRPYLCGSVGRYPPAAAGDPPAPAV
jgi:hypothetical protein